MFELKGCVQMTRLTSWLLQTFRQDYLMLLDQKQFETNPAPQIFTILSLDLLLDYPYSSLYQKSATEHFELAITADSAVVEAKLSA